jgi:HD-like signal output (HDOD) protein
MPIDARRLRDAQSLKVDTALIDKVIEKEIADIPVLPAIVTRILAIVNDPRSSSEELSHLISLDQGLSAKLLRIANSAYYSFHHRVETIQQAVILMGFNLVRDLALTISVYNLLKSKAEHPYTLDWKQFWNHSVAAAVAASLFARTRHPRSGGMADAVFISGLLHDMGKLFLVSHFPNQYAVTLAFAKRYNVTLQEAEKQVMGTDHTLVGRSMGEHWHFPTLLLAAIQGHHHPLREFEWAALTHAGDWLAWQVGIGACEQATAPVLLPEVENWLGLSEADYAEVLRQWEKQFEAAQEIVRAGDGGNPS